MGIKINLSNGGKGRLPIFSAYIQHQRPEIIHFHWTHAFFITKNPVMTIFRAMRILLEVALLKLFGAGLVWTVHNLFDHEQRHQKVDLIFHFVLARLVDNILVHFKSAKDEAIKKYKISKRDLKKIKILPHGNYINCYKNDLTKQEARRKLNLNIDNFLFLFFGSIKPYKGLNFLVQCFKKIDHPLARLFIVGHPIDEVYKTELMDLCASDQRIHTVLKYVPDEDIQKFMNVADLVVLPFHSIFSSGSVMLAMSFGKAILAPELGCIPDILDHKGSILYDPEDKHGLLSSMTIALKKDLNTMGLYNFKLANEYNWSMVSKRLFKVYKGIL